MVLWSPAVPGVGNDWWSVGLWWYCMWRCFEHTLWGGHLKCVESKFIWQSGICSNDHGLRILCVGEVWRLLDLCSNELVRFVSELESGIKLDIYDQLQESNCVFSGYLCIWLLLHSTLQAVMALRDSIKRHLHLPVGYVMEYKPHDASLRDNSSFRNTWLRG